MKHELIQRGFMPATAATLVNVFRRSVQYARHFETISVASTAQSQIDRTDGLDASPGTPAQPTLRGSFWPEQERGGAIPKLLTTVVVTASQSG